MKDSRTCKRFNPVRISEYHDGVLSRSDEERFEKHLSSCPVCLDALRGLNEDLLLYGKRHPRLVAGKDPSDAVVRVSGHGLLLKKSPSIIPVRPLYSARAAGKADRHPHSLAFVLPSGSALLTAGKDRSAFLEVHCRKKGPIGISFKGETIAEAERSLSVLLERKGRYRVRSGARTLFALVLS